jgi:hypothetical protein
MPRVLSYTNPITIPVLPLSTHIDLTGVLKLDGFSEVNFAIVVNQPVLFPLNARVFMGVFGANPLSVQIDSFAVPRTLLDRIRTYPVTGPELDIQLFGDPGAVYPIRAWLYLT